MQHYMSSTRRRVMRRLVLDVFVTGILVTVASCPSAIGPEQGRSLTTSAWKAERDAFLQTTVVYELTGGRSLRVAHLTLSDDFLEGGLFGGSAPMPTRRLPLVGAAVVRPDQLLRNVGSP